MLDMRLGNSGDIPFIMNLVRDGITSGAFFYAEGNGLETVRSELQSVTQQYRDNCNGSQSKSFGLAISAIFGSD
ncbi:TPA: hypothetical protein ACU901_005106 [Klebsiella pneumoniae]